jgi:putative transposase
MMQRKQYSASFKAKVDLEAIKGLKTVNELASEYGVHPTQINQWKKQALQEFPQIFSSRRPQVHRDHEALTDSLYQQIGQLKVELDWLKKNLVCSVAHKRQLVEPNHPHISLSRQCELLNLARSSWYYQPVAVDPYALHLMNLLDQEYTATPFYGIRRLTAWLRTQGEVVNHKRVARLMGQMRIEAIYPRPRTSAAVNTARRYPYLLRDLVIDAPNLVWSTDITDIRIGGGFIYLVAFMDWFSRYVLSWQLSNTLDVHFCLVALEQALPVGHPQILNSDQGTQFTSSAFTEYLESQQIQISQDGKGRAFDNIFVERLWRSLKYEEVYLKEYANVAVAIRSLGKYFEFYNHHRCHQSLNYQVPAVVYFGTGGDLNVVK